MFLVNFKLLQVTRIYLNVLFPNLTLLWTTWYSLWVTSTHFNQLQTTLNYFFTLAYFSTSSTLLAPWSLYGVITYRYSDVIREKRETWEAFKIREKVRSFTFVHKADGGWRLIVRLRTWSLLSSWWKGFHIGERRSRPTRLFLRGEKEKRQWGRIPSRRSLHLDLSRSLTMVVEGEVIVESLPFSLRL